MFLYLCLIKTRRFFILYFCLAKQFQIYNHKYQNQMHIHVFVFRLQHTCVFSLKYFLLPKLETSD